MKRIRLIFALFLFTAYGYSQKPSITWGFRAGMNAGSQKINDLRVVEKYSIGFDTTTFLGTSYRLGMLLQVYQEMRISRRMSLRWGGGYRQRGLRSDYRHDGKLDVLMPLPDGQQVRERFDNLFVDVALRYFFSKRQRRPLYVLAGNRFDYLIHRKSEFWKEYKGAFARNELSPFAGWGWLIPLRRNLRKRDDLPVNQSAVFFEMEYNPGLTTQDRGQFPGNSLSLNGSVGNTRNVNGRQIINNITNHAYSITAGIRF